VNNFYKFILNEELKLSKIVRKQFIDDYTILIGKNAKMNDILTFDIAKPNDIWLHASGVPGSHVIIQVHDNEIPNKNIIQKAAELAATYSKSKNENIKVVWTRKKFVTKNKDHNIGQVNVDYKNSNFINIKNLKYIKKLNIDFDNWVELNDNWTIKKYKNTFYIVKKDSINNRIHIYDNLIINEPLFKNLNKIDINFIKMTNYKIEYFKNQRSMSIKFNDISKILKINIDL